MHNLLRVLIPLILCTHLFAKAGETRVEQANNSALLIIDIQNFYFPGGKWELDNPEKAALNAQKMLQEFRKQNRLVVHVRHNSEPGAQINDLVKPLGSEKVITKNKVNCFLDTELLSYLQEHQIKKLVICGMMTHMCVEAATRAGADLGFECILVEDACATRALEFNGKKVSAQAVHAATLSTLSGSYAQVLNTEQTLSLLKK